MRGFTIAVVDLTTGTISQRPRHTPTLDVPADFDRASGAASVDRRGHATYLSTAGSTRPNTAHPRPLSWRVGGEECLVASPAADGERTRYQLCAVEPAP